ncbi:phosphatidate cytidylyltransferase [Enterovirga sp.]|uniref:phosphatidate cytidylyltransferase n=1 Tax=Enterovirga sp. TaxID=2026350 RepID=UPI00260BEB41|nr:phosphatidate cytidylyltransferase [Enterovirga sp.]
MTATGQGGSGPGKSELRLRTTSSLVLAALAVLTAWTGGWILAALWFCAGMAVLTEWLAMTGVQPARPLGAVATAGLAALLLAYGAGSTLVGAVAVAVVAAAALVLGRSGQDRAWMLAGFGYAAAIVLVPLMLRFRPSGGTAALLWLFAVVWTTDVAAYFAGRRFGGPKLWPAVSPRKTWSGFAGGVAGATLAGLAVAILARNAGVVLPVELPAVAVLSALASMVSQAGDLGESAMKRRFGVKDSGSLIPGHGGFMDRLDGFAAVAIAIGLVLAGLQLATGRALP